MSASTVTITCGVGGCDAKVSGKTLAQARRYRNEHIVSCHPGYKPPSGSIASRVPRLD